MCDKSIDSRSTSQRRFDVPVWLLVAIIVFTAAVARVPDLFHHFQDWDEAAMMTQGWAVTAGSPLYREVFQIHPPLNMLLFTPFFLLLEACTVPHVVKLLNLVVIAISALLIFEICRRWLLDPLIGFTASMLFLLHLSSRNNWAQSSYGELYNIPLILAAVWFLFLSTAPRSRREIAAGLFLGLAVWMKQIALIDSAILLTFYAIRRERTLLASASRIGAGFLVPAGVLGLYLLSTGSLSHAFESLVGVTSRYLMISRDSGTGPIRFIVRQFKVELSIIAVILPVLFVRPRRLSFPEGGRSLAVFWILWALGLVGIFSISRNFYAHYALQVVPAMVLAASPVVLFIRETRRLFILAPIQILIFGLILIPTGQKLRSLSEQEWRPAPVKRSLAVSAFLDRHLDRDDRIFILGANELDIYYLSKRKSNNGIYMYIDMFAEHIGDSVLEERKKAEFVAALPRAMVVDPSVMTLDSAAQFFEPILLSEFVIAASIHGLDVYFRND